jgi:hypothetical protein
MAFHQHEILTIPPHTPDQATDKEDRGQQLLTQKLASIVCLLTKTASADWCRVSTDRRKYQRLPSIFLKSGSVVLLNPDYDLYYYFSNFIAIIRK